MEQNFQVATEEATEVKLLTDMTGLYYPYLLPFQNNLRYFFNVLPHQLQYIIPRKSALRLVTFSHCCYSSETVKVSHLKFEGDTTGHVDHMATLLCTLAEHLNESTTWQWCCFDPTPLTLSRHISTGHNSFSSMGGKCSGAKSDISFFPHLL